MLFPFASATHRCPVLVAHVTSSELNGTRSCSNRSLQRAKVRVICSQHAGHHAVRALGARKEDVKHHRSSRDSVHRLIFKTSAMKQSSQRSQPRFLDVKSRRVSRPASSYTKEANFRDTVPDGARRPAKARSAVTRQTQSASGVKNTSQSVPGSFHEGGEPDRVNEPRNQRH